MEQSFKRISDELKLPRESRERIRSRLVSCRRQTEDIPTEKPIRKSRVPLAAAVAAVAAVLTLTAAAVNLFRNDQIVPDPDHIPAPSGENGAPGGVAVGGPSGDPPAALEEMAENSRLKSDDWDLGERINGGVVSEYNRWDFVEVLSRDPALRSRRVGREDGAEKTEYTAEDPAVLPGTLTGRVTFDLKWMDGQYDHVPDANLSFVVSDAKGDFVSEYLNALYAKRDGGGYVELTVYCVAQADYFAQSFVIDGSYECARYYTSADGYEFLIKTDSGRVWAECRTSRAEVCLYGAYLTADEVEDILDNLSLTVSA